VIGAIGNLAGVRTALTVASLILSPALLLYARALRHRGRPVFEDELAPDKRT
jgi:hypothetical protein